MKKLTSALLGLLLLGFMRPSVANVADVDWLGRLSILGGAESETWKRKDSALGGASHGFGYIEGLAVIPVLPWLGIQMNLNYQPSGDATPRVGGSIAPIIGWSGGMMGSGGKAGFFFTDQFRMYPPRFEGQSRQHNFWWIGPSLALYDLLPNTNTDVWLRVPVSSSSVNRTCVVGCDDTDKLFFPVGQLKAAVNWFPGPTPISTKDNLELTLGIQVNGIAGVGQTNVGSGIGPVFGAALMPWQNVEVQLVKAAMDNHNRYRVTSGFQMYFDTSKNSTLLQLRRKYLEPTNLPGSVSSHSRR